MFEAKFVRKIKTHISCSVTIFFGENHAFYEIMWKNIVEQDISQMTIKYGAENAH